MDKRELLMPIAGLIAVIAGMYLNIIAIHLPELEMIIAYGSSGILMIAGMIAILKTL